MAYNSKYTGAEVEALLEKADGMSVDGYETKSEADERYAELVERIEALEAAGVSLSHYRLVIGSGGGAVSADGETEVFLEAGTAEGDCRELAVSAGCAVTEAEIEGDLTLLLGSLAGENKDLTSYAQTGEGKRNVGICLAWCTALKEARITNVKVAGSLYGAFAYCTSLQSLDLSGWDTSSLTDMMCAFMYCTSLQSLDLSVWDTSSLTNMMMAFAYCEALQSLDLSGWDTGALTDMMMAFFGCEALASLDLSGWDTSSLTDMMGAFTNCTALQSLDLSGWDTGALTDMMMAFFGCEALASLDLSGWDFANVTSASLAFSGCAKLSWLGEDLHNIKVNLGLGDCPLTREAALEVIKGLYDYSAEGGSHTMTFSTATKALLEDDDIEAATAKGWTIA